MSKLAFILSLPRSGSTVLTGILDRIHGVVCPPESSFPQVLGTLSQQERSDVRWVAALYVAATFPGTPLRWQDVEPFCGLEDESLLFQIGVMIADQAGRRGDEVGHVIWKTTRTLTMNTVPLRAGSPFVVLRRNPLNVYESQFRVPFGVNNRRTWRFALFRESYESVFRNLPWGRVLDLEYERIPSEMDRLKEHLGISEVRQWEGGASSLAAVAESRPWLSQILGEFKSTDDEKLARIGESERRSLRRWMWICSLFNRALFPLRAHYDRKTLMKIRSDARGVLGAA